MKTNKLKGMALSGIVLMSTIAVAAQENGVFTQQPLKYAFNALEPHIDAKTMEIHYGRHHAAYTKGFNDAVAAANLKGQTAEEIFAKVSQYPAAVRNQGGGYYNHNLYWLCLSPNAGGEPTGKLKAAIEKDFGSFADFKKAFANAGATQFGSGWAWLILKDGKLVVTSTSNQDNPLMDVAKEQGFPLLAMDVWEHAYYLNYQNKRADYIEAFFNVIDWNYVAQRFENATK